MNFFKNLSKRFRRRDFGRTVTFLREVETPVFRGAASLATYRFYFAASPDDAVAFLHEQDIAAEDFYVGVETPHGRWFKSINGLYRV